jgi:hypothetical protein
MARYNIPQIPEGYAIIPRNGRFYPMQVEETNGVPTAQAIVQTIDGKAVSYAKRAGAANFLYRFISGAIPWVHVHSQVPQETPQEGEQVTREEIGEAAYQFEHGTC